MKIRLSSVAALAAALCVAPLFGGCARWVGAREFIDDSMDEHYAAGGAPAPAAAAHRAAPFVITKGEYDRDAADDADDVVVVLPGRATRFVSIRGELEALERELMRIQTRARLKGAAATAAIDPAVRDFNDSRDVIQDRLQEPQDRVLTAALYREWPADVYSEAMITAEEIDNALVSAWRAVREAAELAYQTPSPTRD